MPCRDGPLSEREENERKTTKICKIFYNYSFSHTEHDTMSCSVRAHRITMREQKLFYGAHTGEVLLLGVGAIGGGMVTRELLSRVLSGLRFLVIISSITVWILMKRSRVVGYFAVIEGYSKSNVSSTG